MIKEQAIVIGSDHLSEGRVLVRVDRKSACESCQMKSGCGQKLLNQGSERRCIEFELENSVNAREGDLVTLAIPEKSFLQASFAMYMLPLVMMIAFAVVAERVLLAGDLITFLSTFLGFLLGLLVARKFAASRQHDPEFLPVMREHEPISINTVEPSSDLQ